MLLKKWTYIKINKLCITEKIIPSKDKYSLYKIANI